MSIAQQVATPTPSGPARRPSAALQPAPARRPVQVSLRIAGLLAITALGVALSVGTVAIAFLLVMSNLTS
jgi:hypothetical protein